MHRALSLRKVVANPIRSFLCLSQSRSHSKAFRFVGTWRITWLCETRHGAFRYEERSGAQLAEVRVESQLFHEPCVFLSSPWRQTQIPRQSPECSITATTFRILRAPHERRSTGEVGMSVMDTPPNVSDYNHCRGVFILTGTYLFWPAAAFLEFHEPTAAFLHPYIQSNGDDTLLISDSVYNHFVKVDVSVIYSHTAWDSSAPALDKCFLCMLEGESQCQ